MHICVSTSRDRTFHDCACPSGDLSHLARWNTFSSSSKSVSCRRRMSAGRTGAATLCNTPCRRCRSPGSPSSPSPHPGGRSARACGRVRRVRGGDAEEASGSKSAPARRLGQVEHGEQLQHSRNGGHAEHEAPRQRRVREPEVQHIRQRLRAGRKCVRPGASPPLRRNAGTRTVPTPISMAYMTTIIARMLAGAHSAMYTGPTIDAKPMAIPCARSRQVSPGATSVPWRRGGRAP